MSMPDRNADLTEKILSFLCLVPTRLDTIAKDLGLESQTRVSNLLTRCGRQTGVRVLVDDAGERYAYVPGSNWRRFQRERQAAWCD